MFKKISFSAIGIAALAVACYAIPFGFFSPTRPAAGVSPTSDDLLAWWKSGDTSSPLVDSYAANNITVTGSPTYEATGKVGNCVDWPGNAYGLVSAVPSAYPFSISCWINTAATTTDNIVSIADSGGLDHYHALYIDSNADLVIASRVHGSSAVTYTHTGTYNDGWYHVVGLWKGDSERELWIDGAYAGEDTSTISFNVTIDRLGVAVLARSTLDSGTRFDGLIDELCIFTDELTEAEIVWLYNSGNGRTYEDL